MNSGVVILLSGGLRSTVLAHYVVDAVGKDKVHALTLNYSPQSFLEVEAARKVAAQLGIHQSVVDVKLPFVPYARESWAPQQTFLPQRTLYFETMLKVFLTQLLTTEDVIPVLLSCEHPELWKDSRLSMPFNQTPYPDLVSVGSQLQVPFVNTWTCDTPVLQSTEYRYTREPMGGKVRSQWGYVVPGLSQKAVERAEAFALHQLKDPLEGIWVPDIDSRGPMMTNPYMG